MNPHLTEIAYMLDLSGSMQSMQEAAIDANLTSGPNSPPTTKSTTSE